MGVTLVGDALFLRGFFGDFAFAGRREEARWTVFSNAECRESARWTVNQFSKCRALTRWTVNQFAVRRAGARRPFLLIKSKKVTLLNVSRSRRCTRRYGCDGCLFGRIFTRTLVNQVKKHICRNNYYNSTCLKRFSKFENRNY